MTVLADRLTPIALEDGLIALAAGYRLSLGSDPAGAAQLSCLGAHLALECGNFQKAHCFNWCNRKATGDDFTVFFRCDELFDDAMTERAKGLGPCVVYPGKPANRVVLLPPHPWCEFAAFETAEDGCRDYCDLLSSHARFSAAWSRAYHGLSTDFAHELGRAGYYTADIDTYTRGLVSIADRILPACARILAGRAHEITDADRAHVAEVVALTLGGLRDTDPAPPQEPSV